MEVKSPLACPCLVYGLLSVTLELIMWSAECLRPQTSCCPLSDHLPDCYFCQQTEVSERRRQALISLLPHLLAPVEKSLQNVSYLALKDLDSQGLFMDFIIHLIPFTIIVKSRGLPTFLTQFQVCRGVLCPEELNIFSLLYLSMQTIPCYRIQKDARNTCVGLEGWKGEKF